MVDIEKQTSGSTHDQERADKIRQLTDKLTQISLLKDPEAAQQQTLAIMAELEASREALGLECVVLGEGESRTVLLTAPVKRHADQLADVSGAVPDGNKYDLGTFHGSYAEYLFVNAGGVGKLSIPTDRNLTVNPTASYFQPDPEGMYFGPSGKQGHSDIDSMTHWAQQHSGYVAGEAQLNQQALADVIESRSYPKPPNVRDPKYSGDGRSQFAKDLRAFTVGNALKPHSYGLTLNPRAVDSSFDTRPLGGFAAEVVPVKVTKPDFISQALTGKADTSSDQA